MRFLIQREADGYREFDRTYRGRRWFLAGGAERVELAVQGAIALNHASVRVIDTGHGEQVVFELRRRDR